MRQSRRQARAAKARSRAVLEERRTQFGDGETGRSLSSAAYEQGRTVGYTNRVDGSHLNSPVTATVTDALASRFAHTCRQCGAPYTSRKQRPNLLLCRICRGGHS